MKTVYAPDAQPILDQVRELVLAYPVAGFALVVIGSALFATWATKHI